MREIENLSQLVSISPDYIGLIFYEKSPRYVGTVLKPATLNQLRLNAKKVGVFVNSSIDEIVESGTKYELDYAQLHGDESPEFAAELYALGISVIKAFGVNEDFDFSVTTNYHPYVDYFLFDTKSENRGGTGNKFNWNLLKGYDQKIPFFLSGGVDLKDIEEFKQLDDLNIHAIDVNSRFEVEPGVKDIRKLGELKRLLYGE